MKTRPDPIRKDWAGPFSCATECSHARFRELEVRPECWRPASALPSESNSQTGSPPKRPRQPISLIKWTGNKRLQAARIVAHFPAEIVTHHEPFLGGGSVLGRLLDSDIRVVRYSCSDSYAPLIALWKLVKDDPERLIGEYTRLWKDATVGGESHYHEVRRSFNRARCPVEFFFLLRTCRVGHVRINAKGDFTSAFDRSRAGTDPDLLWPVVQAWHRKLIAADVRFAVRDHR